MKIKVSDNFAREHISDRLVCENIDEYHGNLIVRFLNSRKGESGSNFYSLESDDHELYVWEP